MATYTTFRENVGKNYLHTSSVMHKYKAGGVKALVVAAGIGAGVGVAVVSGGVGLVGAGAVLVGAGAAGVISGVSIPIDKIMGKLLIKGNREKGVKEMERWVGKYDGIRSVREQLRRKKYVVLTAKKGHERSINPNKSVGGIIGSICRHLLKCSILEVKIDRNKNKPIDNEKTAVVREIMLIEYDHEISKLCHNVNRASEVDPKSRTIFF